MKRFSVLVGDVDPTDLAWGESLLADEFEIMGLDRDGKALIFVCLLSLFRLVIHYIHFARDEVAAPAVRYRTCIQKPRSPVPVNRLAMAAKSARIQGS